MPARVSDRTRPGVNGESPKVISGLYAHDAAEREGPLVGAQPAPAGEVRAVEVEVLEHPLGGPAHAVDVADPHRAAGADRREQDAPLVRVELASVAGEQLAVGRAGRRRAAPGEAV